METLPQLDRHSSPDPEPIIVDPAAELTEGPVWDPQRNRLLWVDITRGLVHESDWASGARRTWHVGDFVGSAAPRADGGVVVADGLGFAFLDEDTAAPVERIASILPVGHRMNDGACDPEGCFWAGSMAVDARQGAGALYRLSREGAVEKMLDGLTISNGLAWSRRQSRMYFVDSGTNGVDVFDWQGDGLLGERRRFVAIPSADGAPDGITIDREDCLWVALWDGWSVRRYSPDGELLCSIELPVAQVTSCAFGSPDLGDLYITTAAHDLSAADRDVQPLAGTVFRVRPGVFGLPTPAYEG